MTTPHHVIRLVGGPPKVDGCVYDLRVSDRDRSDASGGQFVRAVKGSTVTSLASLRARCHDRRTAEELAATWRALVYRPPERRRARKVPVYRFEGYYTLEAGRGDRGSWDLTVAARLTGPTPPSPPPTRETVWSSLEASLDETAARFDAVAALVPTGPLSDHARGARQAVGTCLMDARRLLAVGVTIAPSGHGGAFGDQPAALLARVVGLIQTIDAATAHLVALHLEVDDAVDPVEPVAALAAGWAELGASVRPC
jgi:hypothetical protein